MGGGGRKRLFTSHPDGMYLENEHETHTNIHKKPHTHTHLISWSVQMVLYHHPPPTPTTPWHTICNGLQYKATPLAKFCIVMSEVAHKGIPDTSMFDIHKHLRDNGEGGRKGEGGGKGLWREEDHWKHGNVSNRQFILTILFCWFITGDISYMIALQTNYKLKFSK